MAISKKGKRKITVNSKKYLWWFFDEYDQTAFDGVQIKIVAENQIGYIKYGLQQEEKKRCLVISLREDKYSVAMICPKFEDETGIIKPSSIAKLIMWSLESVNIKNRIFVHRHNPEIEIISERDRLNTFEIILNEFHK